MLRGLRRHELLRIACADLLGRLDVVAVGRALTDVAVATLQVGLPALPFDFKTLPKLTIVACGTSSYAGMVAKYWFEGLARLPVEVDIASEFRYRDPPFVKGGAALFISQSGETIDTLSALRHAKSQGQHIAAIGTGSIVGEMALVGHKPRNARVVAETPMQLLAFNIAAFKKLLETMPGTRDVVMKVLEARAEENRNRERIVVSGEPPNPIDPPSGCVFHPRCPRATEVCREVEPPLARYPSGHLAACHHPLNLSAEEIKGAVKDPASPLSSGDELPSPSEASGASPSA